MDEQRQALLEILKRVIRKDVGAVPKTLYFPMASKAEEVAENTFRFVITSSSVDRYGDIVDADGADMKSYLANPVVLLGHDSTKPIGTCVKLEHRTDGKWVADLQCDVESELGKEAARQIRAGILNATSIGFLPQEVSFITADESDPHSYITGFHFRRWELLEISVCTVQANRDAVGCKAYEQPPVEDTIAAQQLSLLARDMAAGMGRTEAEATFALLRAWSGFPEELVDQWGITRKALSDAGAPVSEHGLILISPSTIEQLRTAIDRAVTKAFDGAADAKQAKTNKACDGCGYDGEADQGPDGPVCPKCGAEMGGEKPADKDKSYDFEARLLQIHKDVQEANVKLRKMVEWAEKTPFDTRAGAVLNKDNMESLRQIRELAEKVLKSAEKAEEGKSGDLVMTAKHNQTEFTTTSVTVTEDRAGSIELDESTVSIPSDWVQPDEETVDIPADW